LESLKKPHRIGALFTKENSPRHHPVPAIHPHAEYGAFWLFHVNFPSIL
jgi:hypothetical protein